MSVGSACSALVIEATNKLFVVFAFSFSCLSLMTPIPNLMDLNKIINVVYICMNNHGHMVVDRG